jgi:hypothetical protein
MTRLVGFIVGLLVAISGLMHSPEALADESGLQTYAYDAPDHLAPTADADTEPGPTVATYNLNSTSAVGHQSRREVPRLARGARRDRPGSVGLRVYDDSHRHHMGRAVGAQCRHGAKATLGPEVQEG